MHKIKQPGTETSVHMTAEEKKQSYDPPQAVNAADRRTLGKKLSNHPKDNGKSSGT